MNVWVQVIGFTSEERHAIQTLFQLSQARETKFHWWTETVPHPPHVHLVDLESHEAELAIQSPSFCTNTKSLVVGNGSAVGGCWRVFERPLVWGAVIEALESLFERVHPVNDSADRADEAQTLPMDVPLPVPPGFKTGLIVGLAREEQLYLKARLALQGIAHVEETTSIDAAIELMQRRRTDILILGQTIPASDVVAFIQTQRDRRDGQMEVVVVLDEKPWDSIVNLEDQGLCHTLCRPLGPHQVHSIFCRL